MQRLDRILAVIDPAADVHPAAAKAARLARRSGAALELCTCDADPALTGEYFVDAATQRRLRAEFLAERTAQLEDIADQLRQADLDVSTHVHWDNPLHEGILRRIAACDPDLVCKDTRYHPVLQRALFTNTDWHLVRSCPVPLLLCRTADWAPRPRLLAALDPGHHGDKPAALDHDIVAAAQLLARHLDGEVEAVHVYFPAALLAATSVEGLPLLSEPGGVGLIEAERERLTQGMLEIAQAHGLDAGKVRVVQGAAAERLAALAAERHADLLVMGAVSRSRLREFFVGSTAERVLDHLPCDVLVIKSVDFRQQLPF